MLPSTASTASMNRSEDKKERRRQQVRQAQARFRDRKDKTLEELRRKTEYQASVIVQQRVESDLLRKRLALYEDCHEQVPRTLGGEEELLNALSSTTSTYLPLPKEAKDAEQGKTMFWSPEGQQRVSTDGLGTCPSNPASRLRSLSDGPWPGSFLSQMQQQSQQINMDQWHGDLSLQQSTESSPGSGDYSGSSLASLQRQNSDGQDQTISPTLVRNNSSADATPSHPTKTFEPVQLTYTHGSSWPSTEATVPNGQPFEASTALECTVASTLNPAVPIDEQWSSQESASRWNGKRKKSSTISSFSNMHMEASSASAGDRLSFHLMPPIMKMTEMPPSQPQAVPNTAVPSFPEMLDMASMQYGYQSMPTTGSTLDLAAFTSSTPSGNQAQQSLTNVSSGLDITLATDAQPCSLSGDMSFNDAEERSREAGVALANMLSSDGAAFPSTVLQPY